jgi:hypothetical protein
MGFILKPIKFVNKMPIFTTCLKHVTDKPWLNQS